MSEEMDIDALLEREIEREQAEGLNAKDPKRKGRKPATLPDTLDEALATLGEREQKFVRHVIAGRNFADAYRLAAPTPVSDGTARTNGQRLASRHAVEHAIRLGKKAGAVQQITGLAYDLKAAHTELNEKIRAAEEAGQFTAVSSLMQQKLKLHGLLIERAQVETASLSIQIEGVDISQLIAPLPAGRVFTPQDEVPPHE